MNCSEFKQTIHSDTINPSDRMQIDLHMEQCPECRQYYHFVIDSVDQFSSLFDDIVPDDSFASEIEKSVFGKAFRYRSIPLWIKLTSAAAAIAIGLFVGKTAYDSRQSGTVQNEYTFINTPADTVYMAETTEIMYFSLINENGDQ